MNHIFIDFIIKKCKKLFKEKLKDYDISWKKLKNTSMMDQIFIKILRIQNIQKIGNQNQKVKEENIIDTYIDIINYIIITLIKLNYSHDLEKKIKHFKILNIYTKELNKIKSYSYNSNSTYENISIDKIVRNIFHIKKKKYFSYFNEKFYFEMLKMITFLLIKYMEKLEEKTNNFSIYTNNEKKNCNCKLEDES
ncbi:nucleotide modification associated domain-containing protein [Blattabacterium cuenoti]|uniref:nucleotide modification associated domain-containing protein n=1 Tax=Blattabacterium cuenoti TaxID=1653831 RepID=UPI00163CFCE7|nr:nucleotide modification associated domain-containing protein [Blattabacterium cuenoti]